MEWSKDSKKNYYCTVFQFLEHYDLDVSGRDRTMGGTVTFVGKDIQTRAEQSKGLLHPYLSFLPWGAFQNR